MLDWVSTNWSFHPHEASGDAWLESWPRRFLRDETLAWVARDGRFSILTDWRDMRFRARGAALVGELTLAAPAALRPLPEDAATDEEIDARISAAGGVVEPWMSRRAPSAPGPLSQ